MRVPRRTRGRGRERAAGIRPVIAYALAGAGVVVAGAGLAMWVAGPAATGVIGWLAALAYAIQLAAFAALWALRGRGAVFFLAWGGGTLARLAAVLGVGLWLGRSSAAPIAAPLLSFAALLFVLLLLEPLFFRAGLRAG